MSRALAAVIVPFLVVAWAILYLLPDRTGELFAWPISPPITSMMLGATYIGGAYFFIRAILARSWEEIALGFLPVTGFAGLLGVATILHWEAFTPGHLSFLVWTTLYLTTPFLVLGVWWANQRQVAGSASPDQDQVALSDRARIVAGGLGLVAVTVSLVLFIWPQQLIDVWPWSLSPLTARVMAAIFALGGAGIGIARDPRWRAVRLLVQVVWVMLGLFLVAIARAWAQLDPGNPLTWVIVIWLVAVLALSAILYARMERRHGLARSHR